VQVAHFDLEEAANHLWSPILGRSPSALQPFSRHLILVEASNDAKLNVSCNGVAEARGVGKQWQKRFESIGPDPHLELERSTVWPLQPSQYGSRKLH
jgi:hypothetical protein